MSDDYRRDLLRIEGKLDQMQAAIVNLARIEERQTTMFNQNKDMVDEIRELRTRITELERVVQSRSPLFKWLNVGGVAAIGAAIGAMFRVWAP